jgi:hypothetical protein
MEVQLGVSICLRLGWQVLIGRVSVEVEDTGNQENPDIRRTEMIIKLV